jgi:hypothetical protein
VVIVGGLCLEFLRGVIGIRILRRGFLGRRRRILRGRSLRELVNDKNFRGRFPYTV